MLDLTERHPKWIMRGCFAHGLNLLMKDFCKFKQGVGRGAAQRTFGMKWAEQCVNTFANFMQDSGPARQLVCHCPLAAAMSCKHHCQAARSECAQPIPHIVMSCLQVAEQQLQHMNGRRPTMAVNVPTRWASNFFVLDSQLQSRIALQVAAAAETWAQLPACSKAGEVRELLMSADYWKHADVLVKLLQPFADAIHQLEGDKPHLADCHLALITLRKHVVVWSDKFRTSDLAAEEPCPFTGRAVATIDRRLEAQAGGAQAPVYNAAYSAAHALDPYYADVVYVPDGPFCSAPPLSTAVLISYIS
jgi:hypothetical protein